MMKNTLLTILLSIITCLPAYAQNEAVYWYFGKNAGVKFTECGPKALTNGHLWQITPNRPCAAISDPEGNLLLYTNGYDIWNKFHEPIQGYTHNYTDYFDYVLILPQPGNENIYYIFVIYRSIQLTARLAYTIVDVNENNGHGKLLAKDKSLVSSDNFLGLSAIRTKGGDYWIGCLTVYNDIIFYRFTKNGLYTIPPVHNNIGRNGNYTNPGLILSPDGRSLMIPNYRSSQNPKYHLTWAFFDDSTGKITGYNDIETESLLSAPASFSPDGTKFYCIDQAAKSLCQLDLSAGSLEAIAGSKKSITDEPLLPKDTRLAPDGKIYVALNGKDYLGVIKYPNRPGKECEYVENAVSLAGRKTDYLPAFCDSWFYREPNPAGYNSPICEGEDLELWTKDIPGAVYSWQGPAGFYSDERKPVIPNAGPDYSGKYSLTVTAPDTVINASIDVLVDPVSRVKILAPVKTICRGQSVTLYASGDNKDIEYLWSTGDTTAEITVDEPGKYYIAATHNCCTSMDSIEVEEFRIDLVLPELDFGEFCMYDTTNTYYYINNDNNFDLFADSICLQDGRGPFSLAGNNFYRNISIYSHRRSLINVYFNPRGFGEYSDTLLLYISSPCEKVFRIPVSGKVKDTKVFLRVPVIYAEPDYENVLIPVMARLNCIDNSVSFDFESALQVNAPVYLPYEDQDFVTDYKYDTYGRLHINLEGRAESLGTSDKVIAWVSGSTLMDNHDTTDIIINEFGRPGEGTGDFPWPLEITNGMLILRSKCQNELTGIGNMPRTDVIISPNPAKYRLDFDITTNEKGLFSIWIYNINGMKVFGHSWDVSTASRMYYEVDVTGLANGFYNVIIKTPLRIINKKVLISD